MGMIIEENAIYLLGKKRSYLGSLPGKSSYQDSVSYSPWAKSGSEPVLVNKVLLEHNQSLLIYLLSMTTVESQWQS
jgi:hypothetical protein